MFGRANAISYMLAKAIEPEKSRRRRGRGERGVRALAQRHSRREDREHGEGNPQGARQRADGPAHWRIVFFSIAGVSLLIGGVGIFSVLKISIGERLYEIGLRKAMGASDAEVFHAVPDRVGDAVGGRRSHRLRGRRGPGAPDREVLPGGIAVSLFGTTVSIGFAISIGLIAGLYPSISASRLEPVEALRRSRTRRLSLVCLRRGANTHCHMPAALVRHTSSRCLTQQLQPTWTLRFCHPNCSIMPSRPARLSCGPLACMIGDHSMKTPRCWLSQSMSRLKPELCATFVAKLGALIVERGHTLMNGCRGSLDKAIAEAANARLMTLGKKPESQLVGYRLERSGADPPAGLVRISERSDWELTHPQLAPPEQIRGG